MLNVQYIPNAAIDRVLWDKCVVKSNCNLVYLQSAFLDAMATNWDAIIVNNYEGIFPLPFRKKWGIKYVYPPAFLQQLGLCTTNDKITVLDILPLLIQHFKYADLHLNFTNKQQENSIEKTNYILPLSKDYNYCVANYSNDLRKNLKKSKKESLIYAKENNISLAISLYRSQYQNRHKSITDLDYKNFEKLCLGLLKKDKVFTRAVYSNNKELLSIALFLFDNNRMYNVMNTTTSEGKLVSANHFLFDKIIEEFAGSGFILDFEGSDLQGVKSFYENFNPVNEPYYYLKINELPTLLKLLKK